MGKGMKEDDSSNQVLDLVLCSRRSQDEVEARGREVQIMHLPSV